MLDWQAPVAHQWVGHSHEWEVGSMDRGMDNQSQAHRKVLGVLGLGQCPVQTSQKYGLKVECLQASNSMVACRDLSAAVAVGCRSGKCTTKVRGALLNTQSLEPKAPNLP